MKSRFFIRSKGDNPVYWRVTPRGQIVASQVRSTRFRVTVTDKSLPGNVVMINSDQVYLGHGGHSVSVAEDGNLQCTGKAEAFRFGDFASGFRVNGYGNELLPGLPVNAIVKTTENDAQVWELCEDGLIDCGDDSRILVGSNA